MPHLNQSTKYFLSVILVFGHFIFCRASISDSASKHKKDKVRIQPVPLISYAPETRILGGVGTLVAFQLHRDSVTHYSLIQAFVAYTQNKQDYYYMPYQLYTKNNNYYLEGEADYYNYSYYYWGIGTSRVPKELYNVHFPRFQLNAYRRITKNFYAGLDYYLEDDMIVGTDPAGELVKSTIPGSTGSISSGFGVDFQYDTRDSIYFPNRGWFIKGLSYFNSSTFGATSTYGKVMTDVSYYTRITPSFIMAFNEHTQFTWGNAPFNQLALVGGTKGMRGYYLGYYRDDIFTFFQAEARLHLIGRFGLNIFGSAGLLGNYNTFPEANIPILAEGIGIRYNYDRKQHVNVRLDAGYGHSVEFYLTILEAF